MVNNTAIKDLHDLNSAYFSNTSVTNDTCMFKPINGTSEVFFYCIYFFLDVHLLILINVRKIAGNLFGLNKCKDLFYHLTFMVTLSHKF